MSINNTRSENLIDSIFEYSPDLILIHDKRGNITNMNENLIKVLGYKSKEDILKLQIKDILNYENKDFILPKFLKLILNKSEHTEYYFKTKKNAHIPVEGFGFPYKIGKLDIIVNISTIIHDKKKLQKELLNTKSQLDNLMVKIPEIRLWVLSQKKDVVEILQKGGRVLKESEKKYRDILESIKEGYFEVDLEGNLVFFNDSLCDILGYSPEELVGKHYRSFMKLENKKLEEFIDIDEIDGKAFEFELIKKNREKIYVESSLSKKQNTEGIEIGFYGLIRDVTKRKEAENKINRKLELERVISKISSLFINPLNYDEAINNSLEFMGKLSNASRSYLFIFNNIAKTMDNTHEWCAKGVIAEKENLQGLSQDMFPWWMIKLNNEEVIHIPDVSMMPEEAAMEKDLLQQQNIKSLLVLPLFIGNILSGFIGFDNVRETGESDEEDFFLLHLSSEIIGNALKRREIEKKLKDSEQNLINLNKELEQRIELRTKKLKESKELYHKAYDQVNFYKDLLTHDISNILQTIKSAGELSFIYINDPKKLNELYEIWNLVNSQVNRGNRLVLNVRRLSQIEYTQIPFQPIEVFSFLQEAIKFTQKGIQERKINFQIDSPFKTYNINANELLLDVFENILINATTYNDNPIIEILIKISKLQKDGIKFLKLEFLDNGIGISDDRKKLIFQKGYKKEKQSKGMGLGLSLVKKIITGYNGQIWVEDKVFGDYTKGSNFIVIIPEE